MGFAPGDETTRIFLESWKLIDQISGTRPEKYYLPLLNKSLSTEINKLAKRLRLSGMNILVGLEEQKIGKALELANKKNISQVIIFGADEASRGIYKIKDMVKGKEKEIKL